MKTEYIALALAGVAVYLLTMAGKVNAGTTPTAGKTTPTPAAGRKGGVLEVLDSGKPYGNGWRYFDNGTAIGPDGSYYQNGAMIWTPATGGASSSW